MPSQDSSDAAGATPRPVPPSQEMWQAFVAVLQEYRRARATLIDGEGMVGDFIFPSANEVRNGWDDLAKVLGRWVPEQRFSPLLDEVNQHFRRARSEVFETVLITRLDTLREILDSLRKDPQYRIAKATHYSALHEAFDRGRVASRRARDVKRDSPDGAVKEAKTGISIVQSAIDAFMDKAGEFELADEVRSIGSGQETLRAEHTAIMQEQATGKTRHRTNNPRHRTFRRWRAFQ